MELKEMRRKLAGLVAQAREIDRKCDAETRGKNPEERASWDKLVAEAEALSAEIDQRERLDALAGVVASGDARGGITLPHQEARNLGKYSVLRAINQCANGQRVDGLEGEVSQELVKQRKREVNGLGFAMPYDLPVGRVGMGASERRALDTTAGVGADSIATILGSTYVDLLRNRMAVRKAGATVMSGMQGNFSLPRQNAATTLYWLAEGGSPTGSRPTIDQVPFTPRTCGAYTDITRRFAEQTNLDAEMFVRNDMAKVVSLGVDLAALNGTGNANQPLGIMQNPSVPVTAIGTNGGAPTWAAVVALETAVSNANADDGQLAYMTNSRVRGKMKTTLKDAASTGPIYLWDTLGSNPTPLNGYPVFVTNQLPNNLTKGSSGAACSPLLFGNWADLVIAFWTGQDVIVDPYTLSSSGGLRIVMLQDVDVNIRHPESFAQVLDLTTS